MSYIGRDTAILSQIRNYLRLCKPIRANNYGLAFYLPLHEIDWTGNMKEIDIEFTGSEWFDHHRRKVVWFTAIVGEKCLDCGISIEALRDHFGAYSDDPLPAFRSNRARIQEAAAKLIMQRRFEDDGTVLIRTADL